MLYMFPHAHVLVAAVSSSLASSTAARGAVLGCHHVAWPLLKHERIKNMREFSERTGACRWLLTIRAVTPDTTTWRSVPRTGWNVTSEGPWTVITSRNASVSEKPLAVLPVSPVRILDACSTALCEHLRLVRTEPGRFQKEMSNALSHLGLMRRVVAAASSVPEDCVLIMEDDVTLHPRAYGFSPTEHDSLVRWACRAAVAHNQSLVYFSLFKPRTSAADSCVPVGFTGLPGEFPGNHSRWPGLHRCTWSASHPPSSAAAYLITKEHARHVVEAWDTLTAARLSALKSRAVAPGGGVCARLTWAGPRCGHDPTILRLYLGFCSARLVARECRSLVLGLDWEDSASSALRAQVGVYLQGRSVFGSTISHFRDVGESRRPRGHHVDSKDLEKAAATPARLPAPGGAGMPQLP